MNGAFAGERAVVAGFGTSGRAAARILLEEGAEVLVSDVRPEDALLADPEVRAWVSQSSLELRPGGHRPEHLSGATLLVVSPGVPDHAPVVGWARRRKLPIWGELELGARICRTPYVGVTGTNGKTTTTEMICSMLLAAGLSARSCGNVGYPFPLAAREGLDALVVEASSFQLRFQESFHPRVSVLLNLAPDHLDWHGSFDAYATAKARIFARQRGDDVHVGNRDDLQGALVSRRAPCVVRWFSRAVPGADPGPGDVAIHPDRLVHRTPAGETVDLGLPAHPRPAFVADAAAASAAALAFGVPAEAVREALASFVPLPHRGSVVARIGSVRFVDDSKATNVHAALTAIRGVEAGVLIAGGLSKGVDLSPLAAGAPHLAAVVAIGEAAPEILTVFDGLVPVVPAGSMEEAVAAAYALAGEGGTVLLAPACASFDMFRDYQERGDRFAAAARALPQRVADAGRTHAK